MTRLAEEPTTVRDSTSSTFADSVARVASLTKIYCLPGGDVEVHALRGVDINFGRGEYVAICGASGSGKSTLLNLLGCLDRPTSGHYFLNNEDVAKFNDDELSEIRCKYIGFVFQSFNLIPQLTLLENVEVPLFYQGLLSKEREEKARELIELVELSDRSHHRPNELSGGQQQRVAIARALINDLIIVLADEPTGNLDSKTGHEVMEVLHDLRKRTGAAIVLVTHNEAICKGCDRMLRMLDGRIEE